MNTENLLAFVSYLMESISSDFFANILSLFELLIAIVAFFIGGKKVLELIQDYNKRKNRAIYGFHVNLKIFIKRIKN